MILEAFNEQKKQYINIINSMNEKMILLEQQISKLKEENTFYQNKLHILQKNIKCISKSICQLKDDEILIIEGIHCLNDKLTYHIPKEFKYKVYISDLTVLNVDYYNRISTTDTRLIRRIVRDYNFRGYSALQTLKTWYSVKRGEEKNIFPYQDEADVMFNSSIVYELSVLKKYVMPLLAEIRRTEREYSEARRIITLLKYFSDMSDELIPNNSLLREFIGGSIFE
jgi:uridine kinase